MRNEIKQNNPKLLMEILQEPLEIKLKMIQQGLELSCRLINQLLEDNVRDYTGERYTHEPGGKKDIVRHGFNPGSVKIGSQKVPIRVPRIRDQGSNECISLETWDEIKNAEEPSEELLKSILLGISTRDYKKVITQLTDSFGVSKSNVSKQFIESSTEALKEFQNRSLRDHCFVGLLIDGKYFRDDQMVIAMGITDKGQKIILDFVQTRTENTRAISQLLEGIVNRGLRYKQGLLVLIDGSKGIHSAIKKTFGKRAVIQRCTWHKRENVVSYLNESNQEEYRKRLQHNYRETNYNKAKSGLLEIMKELEVINPNAAASLKEGFEETLTLQRIGVAKYFNTSLSTTNCIENINRLVQQRTGKVKRWVDGKQKQRWLAVSLLEIEPRLNKIRKYKKLSLLQDALKIEINKKYSEPLLDLKSGPIGPDLRSRMSTKKRT